MTVHQTPELGGLARHLRGRLILPGDQGWDAARQPWNLRVDQRPAAVVAPESADDMAATVAYAARHGLRVTAQSSGHGAGAGLEGTVLLRTGAMREITLDPARNLARVGAGVRCRDLAAAVSPHGLGASVGTAPGAGVAGYAMFGGAGLLGRALGFMASQVVAADVVTADGSRVRCDADSHPDLMWALRGGGGGYALVTRMELRLPLVPEMFGGQVGWPAGAAAEVLGAWRDWTAGLPPQMSSSAAVVQLPPRSEIPEPLRGRRITCVTACYAGPAEAGASLMAELTRVVEPEFSGCRPLTSADLASLSPAPESPSPARIHAELLGSLPDAAISELVRHAQDPDSPLIATEIRHLGGAYAQDPPDGAGAIGRVDAPYLVEVVGMALTPAADRVVRDYERRVTKTLAPWTTGMILPSFCDPSVEGADRAFPPATRRRLADVKDRYDPGNVLCLSFGG